jgi:tripartite-type tricarboxylate transporter receptor subunit TctC
MSARIAAMLRTVLCAAGLVFGTACQAAGYPSQPIHVIVPFPPGAGVDIVTRLVTAKLSTALGQQFIVENFSGAGGNVGAGMAARASADGYTLLAAPSSIAISQSLYAHLPFDVKKDFRAIGMMASVPFILVVNSKVPAKTVADLTALAKAKPGGLTFASTGNGSAPHLTAEMYAHEAQIDLRHVPYRGSAPAMTDLMSGQVDMMFANALSVLPQVQAGRLRALAITSDRQDPNLPDIPTMQQAGVNNFDTGTWFAFLAPAHTPDDVIKTLSHALNETLASPDVQHALRQQGATVQSSTPDQANAFIHSEVDKFARIIKISGTHIE